MADASVPASGGTGPLIDVETLTTGAGSVNRQVVGIGDLTTPGNHWSIDTHSSGQVKLYDAAGNPLLVNPTDAQVGTDLLATGNMRFNGTTWDRDYNSNWTKTVLASAARTVTTASATFDLYNMAGIAVEVNITAGTSPSLSLLVSGATTLNSAYTTPISAPMTTLNNFFFVFCPGATATPYGAAGGVMAYNPLPLWGQFAFVVIVPGNSNSITYSITIYPIAFS